MATLSMKLLIDTKAGRVLLAEASKDVVDFLFSLVALPVGAAVKLVGKDAIVGWAGNLYATYVQTGAAKKAASAAGGVTAARGGLVQGVVTYTVTDDMMVAPMSAISSFTLLNTFGVRDLALADLQEKTVQVGYNEGLEILKASLQSKTVLTDVFLGNKKAPGGPA
ncbi:unnamed protein product [Urochloa humidicola]